MLLRAAGARAAAACVAVAAYALPLSVSVITHLAHDAYHLRERLGVVVLADQDIHVGDDLDGFVHAHGGAAHSHDATTDALLGTAERTDEQSGEHHAPATELSGHIPAQAAEVSLVLRPLPALQAHPAATVSRVPLPPPVPPPRA